MTSTGPCTRLAASHLRSAPVGFLLGAGLALLVAAGCTPAGGSRPVREDGVTSGTLRVASEPEVVAVIRATGRAFTERYPEARILVEARSSRDAMADVFADRADVAVVGREFEPVEREAAMRAGVELEAHRWARDGVAVLTDPTNPVRQVSLDEVGDALSGRLKSWAELGGPEQPITPVLPAPERGLTQYLIRAVLDTAAVEVPSLVVPNDSSVVAAVRRTPGALGFASLAVTAGARPLAVSRVKGLPYVEPDAETVYRRDYPLTRSYNLVVRVPGLRLGGGFLTFALSTDGQRLVRNHGLVPASVPVRFTRRLPSVPSH